MGIVYENLKRLLFCLEPERAHNFALHSARIGGAMLGSICAGGSVEGRAVEVAGLRFSNALGLAAGFDKNGVALPYWRAMGFGHVEFGTVTPRPQPGNALPRMWRFPEQQALGNRLGFPSEGAKAVAERLAAYKQSGDVIGINLGKNKVTPLENAADDYVEALRATRSVADYWVVNVSSPNTPGLRELQSKTYLTDLLSRVKAEAGNVPLFVKLSPDMSDEHLAESVESFQASGCTGIVATNTTLARPDGMRFEGGLSGRPLAVRSRDVLIALRGLVGPDVPIISVGGIDSPEEARARIDAGANLVQLYSALVFEGPRLPARIVRGLLHS